MNRVFKLIFFVIMIVLSANAWASEKMKEPTVEYSANMIIDSGQGSINSKVYHALGGKDRQEMSVSGSKQIIITRLDKNVGWVLMPDQKTYMEMDLAESKEESPTNMYDCEIDYSSLGNEMVNGIKTTKNKVTMSCDENIKYDGTIWFTEDNIMVKMEVTGSQGLAESKIKMELNNLKIASQDPALFELPSGYQEFRMGDISSMFNSSQSMPAQGSMEKGDYRYDTDSNYESELEGEETANDSADTEETNNVMDAIGKLRGLFGK